MSRHVVQLRLDVVPYFSVQVSNLPGQIHIYMRVSGRNRHTCHNTCNHASIDGFCQTRNELTVFSANTCLKDGTKTQRNEIVRSLIAIDYSHSRTKTAQQSLHHGRPFATEAIQKNPNARYKRHQQNMMGSARAQLNTQNFLKKTQDPQLLFSCCVFAAVGQPPAHPKTAHAHLTTNWLETATTANVAPRRPTAIGARLIFLRSRRRALGTNASLHAGVRSQLTHLPRHTQSLLNQCFFVQHATNLPCSPPTHC